MRIAHCVCRDTCHGLGRDERRWFRLTHTYTPLFVARAVAHGVGGCSNCVGEKKIIFCCPRRGPRVELLLYTYVVINFAIINIILQIFLLGILIFNWVVKYFIESFFPHCISKFLVVGPARPAPLFTAQVKVTQRGKFEKIPMDVQNRTTRTTSTRPRTSTQ